MHGHQFFRQPRTPPRLTALTPQHIHVYRALMSTSSCVSGLGPSWSEGTRARLSCRSCRSETYDLSGRVANRRCRSCLPPVTPLHGSNSDVGRNRPLSLTNALLFSLNRSKALPTICCAILSPSLPPRSMPSSPATAATSSTSYARAKVTGVMGPMTAGKTAPSRRDAPITGLMGGLPVLSTAAWLCRAASRRSEFGSMWIDSCELKYIVLSRLLASRSSSDPCTMNRSGSHMKTNTSLVAGSIATQSS
mmetsp:Transcript_51523/g.129428  ORF Transcript_51523/g.129428 Transcript_51523/m.129428 type:complete len:249 (-) Transcript_51523:19-765(-)